MSLDQADNASDTGTSRWSKSFSALKRMAPWVVAIVILYFLFTRVPLADAWSAARAANLGLFLPLMSGAVILWFLIDSAAFAFLFTRFNAKLDWAEARSLRGMTYLLTPINWNLGTAAVILHLRTSKEISALESTSTMVLYQMIDGLVLASFAALGLLLLPSSLESDSLRNVAVGFVMFQLMSLAVLVGGWLRWPWVERIRGLGLFRSHRAAVWRDIVTLTLMKIVYFAVFVGIFWLGCQSFDVAVPLRLAAAATPVILMAGALPITPAGLGTQQAAMLFFFAPYGDDASILAFGLTFPVVLLLLRAVLGLPYLKDLSKLRATLKRERTSP